MLGRSSSLDVLVVFRGCYQIPLCSITTCCKKATDVLVRHHPVASCMHRTRCSSEESAMDWLLMQTVCLHRSMTLKPADMKARNKLREFSAIHLSSRIGSHLANVT